ncbi:MAG TPA: site-specific integrase [Polyangiaceae bacterium]|nr:site-specific integrase [Polyangiaceae bacterium]
MKELRKVLPEASEVEASAWLETQLKQAKETKASKAQPTPPFATYAISVLEAKTKRKELTLENQDRWRHALRHLIQGIPESDDKHRGRKPAVAGFGEMLLSDFRVRVIESWKTEVYALIHSGRYTPSTANGWLAILKVILKQGRRDFELAHNPIEGVKLFDTSMHEVHSEEDPNALNREQIPTFLRLLRALYPQHYAMGVFGFATGLRGTNISPLRIRGEKPDINWETGVCYVRRGAGRLGGLYNTTKQKRRYRITLPPSLLEVLRWHIDTQIPDGPARDSEYLFPTSEGSPRLATVMNKPFAEVSRQMGLPFALSVHGMRRTFNDMALANGVNNLVTRSVSGHLTDKMQEEYTTVWAPLQKRAIDAVMAMMATGKPLPGHTPDPLPALRAVG